MQIFTSYFIFSVIASDLMDSQVGRQPPSGSTLPIDMKVIIYNFIYAKDKNMYKHYKTILLNFRVWSFIRGGLGILDLGFQKITTPSKGPLPVINNHSLMCPFTHRWLVIYKLITNWRMMPP